MKIRITQPGIYGLEGQIAVGTEFTLKDDAPAGWAGKYEIVTPRAKAGTEPVLNDVQPPEPPVPELEPETDETDPFDHDADGNPGGSLPRRGRPPRQRDEG